MTAAAGCAPLADEETEEALDSVERSDQALQAAGASSRSDWNPINVEWGFHRKNRSPHGQVAPLFKCIDKNKDGSFTAHFGYKTSNKDVTVPYGRFNQFLPGPANRGQPTLFRKNTSSNDLFTVKSSSKLLAWFLNDDLIVASAWSKVCAAPKVCPASCDDANPCTVDSCGKNTGFQCAHVNASNGTSCGDGNVCNGSEACQAPASGSTSICTPGTALACDDGNGCTTDSCDRVSGCQHGNEAAGFTCTPEAACTTAGKCDGAGTCTPGSGKNCDDGNPCTADGCAPDTGCFHENLAGVSCSDGKACNGEETCDGAGLCQPGVALVCNDGNECTADACNDSTGCVYDASAQQGRTCTASGCGGSVCSAGVCAPTSGVVCNDNNPCTVDSCGANNTCINAPAAAGTSCSDNEFCNGAEQCDGRGACSAGSAPCQTAAACQTATCDAAAGRCVTNPVTCAAGQSCTPETGVCAYGATCGTGRGGVPSANNGQYSFDSFPTRLACQASCDANPGCQCIVYADVSTICSLHTKKCSEIRTPGNGLLYYDKFCPP